MMIRGTQVVRNSLISLVMGIAAAAAWAAPPPSSAPSATDKTAPSSNGVVLGDSATVAAATQPAPGLNIPIETPPQPPRPRVLDLKAPDIREVMSMDQIAAAIPNPNDLDIMEPETVMIHGGTPPPYVPGGFGALYWAAIHPASAWRILAPVQ
jgi:hypothetical protein